MIYFNTEIGQAENAENAKLALLQTAKTYSRVKQHCSAIYQECHDVLSICLIHDEHGFYHSLKDCFRSIPKENSEVKLMIYGLSKGTRIDVQEFNNLEGWLVDELDVHSPLMEYATKRKGMLLTIAVTNDWKCDFFTFREQSCQLPNIWGQENINRIEQWIESWYIMYNSHSAELLRNCNDIILCPGALPEETFTHKEWINIGEHFRRVRERDYTVDNSLMKHLLPNKTKHGPLYELRLVGDGIRILFSLRESKPIIGGYYRYGTGESLVRDNNSKTAITRINAHN